MTLNFSHCPMFPSCNPSASGLIPVVQDKIGDVFGSRSCCIDLCSNESYNYGRDSGGVVASAGSCEPTCTDIVDLLPPDPFGMNLDSTFKAAIAFWIEDMAVNYSVDHWRDNHSGFDYTFGTSLCFPLEPGLSHAYSSRLVEDGIPDFLNCTARVGAFPMFCNINNQRLHQDWSGQEWPEIYHPQDQLIVNNEDTSHGELLVYTGKYEPPSANVLPDEAVGHLEDMPGCAGGVVSFSEELSLQQKVCDAESADSERLKHEGVLSEDHTVAQEDGGPPHEGLLFALRHLGVQDLLSVERVCKRLCFAVQTDPLLWRCFHIDHPLNKKLTDDGLLQLTKRADGRLQCLDLVECVRITDSGLQQVVQSNPGITKLSVPGCARLTVDGVVNSLKIYKTPGSSPMKYLRVGGIYGVTWSHYEDLKSLIGTNGCQQQSTCNPRFYHIGYSSPSCDYGSVIDIEVCPKCQDLRLVYDCSSELCKGKTSNPCRACIHCIPRCANCGRCLNDDEYEETFCLDFVCMECLTHCVHHEKENMKRDLASSEKLHAYLLYKEATIIRFDKHLMVGFLHSEELERLIFEVVFPLYEGQIKWIRVHTVVDARLESCVHELAEEVQKALDYLCTLLLPFLQVLVYYRCPHLCTKLMTKIDLHL